MKTSLLIALLCLFVFATGAAHATDTVQVTISWRNTDSSNLIQLEKAPASTGPFVFLALLDANSTQYVDTHNAPGSTACYRMAYYNGAALGHYTTPKCKTFPLTPPTKPSTVAAQ